MEKVHVLSVAPARRNARRGIALGAIVAAIVVVLGAASLASFDDFSARAVSEASATHVDAPVPRVDQRSDFDYFPSHYRNQATEPAEPIATF